MDGEKNWTPLQEAYIGKLMATYRANLCFFHEAFPAVFRHLMSVELPAPFEVGPEGEVTIFAGRFKGHQYEFAKLGKMLFELFDDPMMRPYISVDTNYLDEPDSITSYKDNPDFYRHIEPTFRTELLQRFQEVVSECGSRSERADFGKRKLPLVMVFGTGYGSGLERLVSDYEIRHLLLVDTDIARLNLSLYFVDYLALYQSFAQTGRSLIVASHDDIPDLARSLIVALKDSCPPYFIQGAGLFFEDYDSASVKELWEALRADFGVLFRGWGFLDDEILGCKQAVENLVDGWPVFSHKADLPDDAVAFIVGNGPSLDQLFPLLKEYGDRAVVISCGTSISALAMAGIKPDFHLEIERTQLTYRFLETPHVREWLKDVPVMASVIMAPGVYSLTPKPLMFLKELDLGSMLADFHGDLPKVRTNPTCTNGGVDLALKLGFKEIYLVGVDLGFHSSEFHHSKSSIYYNDAERSNEVEGWVQQTHRTLAEARPVPGNFVEEVLSTSEFIYSRDAMQLSISEHPDKKVFNLNDGALIGGASPLKPEAISIRSTPESKKIAVEKIFGAFESGVGKEYEQNIDRLVEQLDAVALDLARILSREVTDRLTAADALAEMHEYFFAQGHQGAQIFPLFRGSFLHMGRFTYDAISRIGNDAAAARFAKDVFDMYQRFLAAARENLLSLKDVGAARRAQSAPTNSGE